MTRTMVVILFVSKWQASATDDDDASHSTIFIVISLSTRISRFVLGQLIRNVVAKRYLLCLVTGGLQVRYYFKPLRSNLGQVAHSLSWGAMANWLEHSLCNAKSTGSNLVQDNHCVRTLCKSLTHNCSAVLFQSAPSRCVNFWALREKGNRILE